MKLLFDENLSRKLVGRLSDLFWLRGSDYPTRTAERLLRGQAIRIAEFLEDEDQGVLILTA